MQINSVHCSNCGAPLEVPSNVTRVTCLHCGSPLIVHRTESTVFTEAVQAVVESVEALTEETRRLRSSMTLQDLDREWDVRRSELEIVGKHGYRSVPTFGSGLALIAIVGGFGTLWTIFAISLTSMAPSFGPFIIAKIIFPLFGVVFTLLGVSGGISTMRRAAIYEQEKNQYLRRRSSLSQHPEQARGD